MKLLVHNVAVSTPASGARSPGFDFLEEPAGGSFPNMGSINFKLLLLLF